MTRGRAVLIALMLLASIFDFLAGNQLTARCWGVATIGVVVLILLERFGVIRLPACLSKKNPSPSFDENQNTK